MKNKSPLMLMEQILMVLVFSLAAAFCLRAFILSETLSVRNQLESDAALLAQNAVETLKGCGGDFEEAAALLGGHCDGESWTMSEDGFTLTVKREESAVAGLGKAQVDVASAEGEHLFALTAAWQEVSGDA